MFETFKVPMSLIAMCNQASHQTLTGKHLRLVVFAVHMRPCVTKSNISANLNKLILNHIA